MNRQIEAGFSSGTNIDAKGGLDVSLEGENEDKNLKKVIPKTALIKEMSTSEGSNFKMEEDKERTRAKIGDYDDENQGDSKGSMASVSSNKYSRYLRKRRKRKSTQFEIDDYETLGDNATSKKKKRKIKKKVGTSYKVIPEIIKGQYILNTLNLFSKKDQKDVKIDRRQILVDENFGENVFTKLKSARDVQGQKPGLEIGNLLDKINMEIDEANASIKGKNEKIKKYTKKILDLQFKKAQAPQAQGGSLEKKDRTASGEMVEVGSRVIEIKDKQKDYQELSYISCDVRYYNFEYLTNKIGSFDVILVDPPWRIKGGQKNDSQFMFSNSKFCLDYNTMSNQEIKALEIEKLSRKGFIFLWILANQVNESCDILGKWGYELVDMIVWVKVKDGKVYLSHGYYLMHSYEICLVGYKCPMGEHVEYYSKVSNNLLFANVRKKSQKPDELYEMIELMMPGSKKIEIFARNNNLRKGWVGLGNQIGPQFDKWQNEIKCNICQKKIHIGGKRFKCKSKADYDVCAGCFKKDELDPEEFFELRNDIAEDVLHHYHACDGCGIDPIWGVRFECHQCGEFDFCEGCYDKWLSGIVPASKCEQSGSKHEFRPQEIPVLAGGFPAHLTSKCNSCFQKPIIGVKFKCSICRNFDLCQNCYFGRDSIAHKNLRGHKVDHPFEIYLENDENKIFYECKWCELQIKGSVYKCSNCFDFHFCEKCFMKRKSYRPIAATTHKPFHQFSKLDSVI